MDEMAYKLPHPPSNLPLARQERVRLGRKGGGSYLPSLSGGGQGWGWGNWWSHLDNPIADCRLYLPAGRQGFQIEKSQI
jgi:hypothetical protein